MPRFGFINKIQAQNVRIILGTFISKFDYNWMKQKRAIRIIQKMYGAIVIILTKFGSTTYTRSTYKDSPELLGLVQQRTQFCVHNAQARCENIR